MGARSSRRKHKIASLAGRREDVKRNIVEKQWSWVAGERSQATGVTEHATSVAVYGSRWPQYE